MYGGVGCLICTGHTWLVRSCLLRTAWYMSVVWSASNVELCRDWGLFEDAVETMDGSVEVEAGARIPVG